MPNESGVFVFGGYTTLNIAGDGFLPLPQVLGDMHVCTVEAASAAPKTPAPLVLPHIVLPSVLPPSLLHIVLSHNSISQAMC